MLEIYRVRMKEGASAHGGYSKVKVRIEWVDGRIMIDRVDVGTSQGDWHPPETVGQYMAQQNSAMYESSFQYEKDEKGEITDRERENYAWSDAGEEQRELTRQEAEEILNEGGIVWIKDWAEENYGTEENPSYDYPVEDIDELDYIFEDEGQSYKAVILSDPDSYKGWEVVDWEKKQKSKTKSKPKSKPKSVSDSDRKKSTKNKMEVFVRSIENACKEYLRS